MDKNWKVKTASTNAPTINMNITRKSPTVWDGLGGLLLVGAVIAFITFSIAFGVGMAWKLLGL